MRLLLHACCAPCSAAIIEYLLAQDIRPALFFFNPNIFPAEEYEVRKAECIRYALSLGLEIIDADYNHEDWLKCVKGLENEPERGKRCLECFKMRMLKTAVYAHENGFDTIATTLASSRWKSLEQIAEAGHWAAAQVIVETGHAPSPQFWEKNWRKDGFQERRKILLQENGFYNQKYCGCEFSFRQ
jgi:predicted adenine nucleotide alpha hydrolase (AANH) superfamily ATPase